jgi:hypothetical protein
VKEKKASIDHHKYISKMFRSVRATGEVHPGFSLNLRAPIAWLLVGFADVIIINNNKTH